MTQPCSTALWPTETPVPMVTVKPGSTWTVALSWMLLPAPSLTGPQSARSTALYQRLEPSAMTTSPITTEPGAVKAPGSISGSLPPIARTVVPSAMPTPSLRTP